MKNLRSFFLRNNYSVTIGSSFITNLTHNHYIEKKMVFYVFYMGCSDQYFDVNLSYYLNIWKYWIFVNTFTSEKNFFAFFTLINWQFFKFDFLWNLLDKKYVKFTLTLSGTARYDFVIRVNKTFEKFLLTK